MLVLFSFFAAAAAAAESAAIATATATAMAASLAACIYGTKLQAQQQQINTARMQIRPASLLPFSFPFRVPFALAKAPTQTQTQTRCPFPFRQIDYLHGDPAGCPHGNNDGRSPRSGPCPMLDVPSFGGGRQGVPEMGVAPHALIAHAQHVGPWSGEKCL